MKVGEANVDRLERRKAKYLGYCERGAKVIRGFYFM
jgi:hypothetical protein